MSEQTKAFVWTGDLDDDCLCRWGKYAAHVEMMDSHTVKGDGDAYECESWWCAVYKGKEQVWSPTDVGGTFTTGSIARTCCEMFMEYDASRAESAALRESLAAAEKQSDTYEIGLQNLLAVIHRDGGQHSEYVGIAAATAEAHDIVTNERASRDALAAELAEARKVMHRQAEDIEIMQDVLDALSYSTVGPATMDNLGEAGRNEVELRIELADKARRRCHCWKEAEANVERDQAAEDKALAARDSGKASGGRGE